jgi:S1-C subfamily serine protease
MNFTGKIGGESPEKKVSGTPNQGRRVSTGTMPDFAYSGEGVKVGAVSEDSPGEKAGLRKGDIIKKLDGKEIKSLRDYSNLLKEHSPGDQISLEVERDGKALIINLILSER